MGIRKRKNTRTRVVQKNKNKPQYLQVADKFAKTRYRTSCPNSAAAPRTRVQKPVARRAGLARAPPRGMEHAGLLLRARVRVL